MTKRFERTGVLTPLPWCGMLGSTGKRGKDMPDEQKKDMTCREAGRKGGQTTSERHGLQGAKARGEKGGNVTLAKHGREFYERIGKKGAAKLKALVKAGRAAAGEEVEP